MRLAVAGLLLSVGILSAAAQTPSLRAPFEDSIAGQPRAMPSRSEPEEAVGCPLPPPAVRNLSHELFYTDAEASRRDESLFRRQLQKTEPLREFVRRLAVLSGASSRSGSQVEARPHCALAWLDSWARQDALLGEVSTWARFDTIWFAQIAAGMNYLHIRSHPGLDMSARRRIEAWLVKVARTAVAEEAALYRPQRKIANHHYWAGAAASVAGIAAQDHNLAELGFRSALNGLSTIDSAGALPTELARQGRAFTYHIWALEPLMLSLALGRSNGRVVSPALLERLRRTMNLIHQARGDGEVFQRLSGHRQVVDTTRWPSEPADLAFAELYVSMVPDPLWSSLLSTRRPIVSERLGGNLTTMFRATAAQ